MASNLLQGLNVVLPPNNSDSHDLLSGQPYPDLSAQLDLWTNLTFECEDLSSKNDGEKYITRSKSEEEEEESASQGSNVGEAAIRDGHVNVVTGTSVGANNGQEPSQAFDLASFLAGFGIDPFSQPPPVQQYSQMNGIAPSLAQLIALHAAPGMPTLPTPPTGMNSTSSHHSTDDTHPPAKRARARKSSVSTADSPESRPREESISAGPVSAAEDKRRRNTAASARFRLKKKEREAALEGKAKELETRVNELERECEGLRRENGWLKGLVVGVTGATQTPSIASGTKRTREVENT